MIGTQVIPFRRVLSQPVNKSLDRLWDVVWNVLKGGNTWYKLGNHPYEIYLEWFCSGNQFEIARITGTLDNKSYRMEFVGLAPGYFSLVWEKTECFYYFTSDPNYGHFLPLGQSFYVLANAGYILKSGVNQPLKYWLENPRAQPHVNWLMDGDREAEVCDFVNRLCDAICAS